MTQSIPESSFSMPPSDSGSASTILKSAARYRATHRSNGRSDDELKDIFGLYVADDATLDSVGQQLGVTRERIRQLLVQGSKRGLYTYPLPADQDSIPDLQAFIDVLKMTRSLVGTAEYFRVSAASLRDWIRSNNISDSDIEKYKREGRREKAFDSYMKLVEELGEHPTTTLLQREQRELNTLIQNVWGTVGKFREEFGIPPAAPGNRTSPKILKSGGFGSAMITKDVDSR